MSDIPKSDQKVFDPEVYNTDPMKEVIEDGAIDNNLQVPGPIPFAAWLIIVSR